MSFWFLTRDERIVLLHRQGQSLRSIARLEGISHERVRMICDAAGSCATLQHRSPAQHDLLKKRAQLTQLFQQRPPLPLTEIARRLGHSPGAISRACRTLKLHRTFAVWQRYSDQQIAQMAQGVTSVCELARRLGTSAQSLHKMARPRPVLRDVLRRVRQFPGQSEPKLPHGDALRQLLREKTTQQIAQEYNVVARAVRYHRRRLGLPSPVVCHD